MTTYINPGWRSRAEAAIRRSENLYDEAVEKGYTVQRPRSTAVLRMDQNGF